MIYDFQSYNTLFCIYDSSQATLFIKKINALKILDYLDPALNSCDFQTYIRRTGFKCVSNVTVLLNSYKLRKKVLYITIEAQS